MRTFTWVLIFAAILAAAIGAGWCTFHFYAHPTSAADFGNAFGFVNAVVSGLALLLVAFSLRQTQEELREGQKQFDRQQAQLQQNTTALKEQKDELARQVNVMVVQAFDTRFFQLLNLLQNIVDGTVIPQKMAGTGIMEISGRAVFRKLYDELRSRPQMITGTTKTPDELPPDLRRQKISETYRVFHDLHNNDLGHYFRTLYHIVLYVDKARELNSQQKYDYVKLVRAQLSQHQLLMLFYNCLTDGLGHGDFFTLVERYHLLKNMGRNELLSPGDVRLYPSLDKVQDGETVKSPER